MDPVVVATAAGEAAHTSPWAEAVKYGIGGVLALAFAYVIIYLYKENRADRREAAANEKSHAAELATLKAAHEKEMVLCKEHCRIEKETIRADYEKKHREVLEGYTVQLTQVRATFDKREEDIRRDSNANVEKLANANKESAEALVDMLQQFLAKVVR